MLRSQYQPFVPVERLEVSSATLNRWPEIAKRESRIVPEMRDGRTIGFRLWSIRPDGLIAAAGFRNGDVVVALNAYPLSTPDKALLAYAKLRNASHYRIDIERQGRPMTLDLDPVPSPRPRGRVRERADLASAAPADPSP